MKPWFVVVGVGAALLSGAMALQSGRSLVGVAMVLVGAAMTMPLWEPQKAAVQVPGTSVRLSGWRRITYWLLAAAATALLMAHMIAQA